MRADLGFGDRIYYRLQLPQRNGVQIARLLPRTEQRRVGHDECSNARVDLTSA